MSTALPAQPPGQPQSKASPIAQLTVAQAVLVDDESTAKSSQAGDSRVKSGRVVREPKSNDPTSVSSTITLIQRILAPDKITTTETSQDIPSIEDILPPLTSSNDVDLELYAILAIIVKDFVNTWYTKITPDNAFVEEIVQIIAHCSRALEQRLRQTDIPALLIDEIPLLVQTHVEAYRTAKTNTNHSPYSRSLRHVYHELFPHPALTPTPIDTDLTSISLQESHERAYRQILVQGALAVLLPTEDLQNDPLRVLVGDIIADLIIGQALAGKVCNGWFLHDAISKVTAVLSDKVHPKASGSQLRDDAKNRLEKFGLLSPDPKFQHLHSSPNDQSKIAAWFWRTMQYGYLVYLFLRYVLKEFNNVRNVPKRHSHPRSPLSPVDQSAKPSFQAASQDDHPIQPVLAFGIFGMLSTLLRLGARMPWCSSMLEFLQHLMLEGMGRVAEVNSSLDRTLDLEASTCLSHCMKAKSYDLSAYFMANASNASESEKHVLLISMDPHRDLTWWSTEFLCHAIELHVLQPSLLPMILRNLRVALFPNNSMGPPAPPPPSIEERKEIKRAAANSMRDLVPKFVMHTFYATDNDEEVADAIQLDILDPLDDIYLNKHLAYAILELVLVRLIPELAEQPVSDLLAERGVGSEDVVIDWDSSVKVADNNTKESKPG